MNPEEKKNHRGGSRLQKPEKPQREKNCGTKIQASHTDISFRQIRLQSVYAGLKPALLIKYVFVFHNFFNYRMQCAPRLPVRKPVTK